ncbi:hypothetical protein CAI21_08725 [Alkalilimnicola ehrlichii]|uniref:hypothetical protein n=1 Tax=Alkalilimnicola ehrlichii TaxID=351052 RepID=UPI000E2EB7E9|nr:hypothetical protein [Alkalilimnicola ehrlichii]RFA29902.1 hypothetical protein CAI21_08725 [Alkalilimnicola ehrlichii]
MLEDAQETGRVRLPVARDATWPLVEQSALAVLYALVLEKGLPGESYLAVTEAGAPVVDLADKVNGLLGLKEEPVFVSPEVWMNQYGSWASGYGLSQMLAATKAKDALGW